MFDLSKLLGISGLSNQNPCNFVFKKWNRYISISELNLCVRLTFQLELHLIKFIISKVQRLVLLTRQTSLKILWVSTFLNVVLWKNIFAICFHSFNSYVRKSTFSCIDVETQYTYIFFSLQVFKKREICFEIFYTLPYYVIRSKQKLFQKWHFLHNFSHLMTPP